MASATTSAAEALLSVACAAVAADEASVGTDDIKGKKRDRDEEETMDGSRKHRHNVTERRRVERNNQAFEELAAVLQSRPELYRPSSNPCRTKLALLQESAECMKAMFSLVDELIRHSAHSANGGAADAQSLADALRNRQQDAMPNACAPAVAPAVPAKRHAEAPSSPSVGSLPSPDARQVLWPRQANEYCNENESTA